MNSRTIFLCITSSSSSTSSFSLSIFLFLFLFSLPLTSDEKFTFREESMNSILNPALSAREENDGKERNGDPFWEHYGLLPSPFVSVKSIASSFFFKRSSNSVLSVSSIFSLTSSVLFFSFSYVIFWHSWEREENAFPRVRNRVLNLTHSVTFTTFSPFLSISPFLSLLSSLSSPPLLLYVIYSLVGSVSQTRQLMMQSRKSLLPRSSFLNPNGMEFEISFLEQIFFPASASYSAFYSVSISSFDSFSLSTGWKTNTITMMIMTMITIAKRMDSQSTPFFILLSLILYQEKRMKPNLTFSL